MLSCPRKKVRFCRSPRLISDVFVCLGYVGPVPVFACLFRSPFLPQPLSRSHALTSATTILLCCVTFRSWYCICACACTCTSISDGLICEELDDFRTRPMLCLCCIAALYLCLYLCLRLRLCNGRPSTAAHISPHMDSLARRVYVLTLTAEQMRKRSMTS